MEIKVKILGYDTKSRSCTVNVYTPKLREHHEKVVWPARAKNLKDSGARLDDDQALERAKREVPAGGVWNVTFYGATIPTGQELTDFLIARTVGRGEWLEVLEHAIDNGREVEDAIAPLVGQELTGATDL